MLICQIYSAWNCCCDGMFIPFFYHTFILFCSLLLHSTFYLPVDVAVVQLFSKCKPVHSGSVKWLMTDCSACIPFYCGYCVYCVTLVLFILSISTIEAIVIWYIVGILHDSVFVCIYHCPYIDPSLLIFSIHWCIILEYCVPERASDAAFYCFTDTFICCSITRRSDCSFYDVTTGIGGLLIYWPVDHVLLTLLLMEVRYWFHSFDLECYGTVFLYILTDC